ncbi:hypothetical protein C8J57DRAFT_1321549 [Mycena rebaudengoi]|nr:hypothetical protein C8J57DRAFT_1321549 [Mycena rebaudengoi]
MIRILDNYGIKQEDRCLVCRAGPGAREGRTSPSTENASTAHLRLFKTRPSPWRHADEPTMSPSQRPLQIIRRSVVASRAIRILLSAKTYRRRALQTRAGNASAYAGTAVVFVLHTGGGGAGVRRWDGGKVVGCDGHGGGCPRRHTLRMEVVVAVDCTWTVPRTCRQGSSSGEGGRCSRWWWRMRRRRRRRRR